MIQTTKQFLFKFRMCNDTLQAILLKKTSVSPKAQQLDPQHLLKPRASRSTPESGMTGMAIVKIRLPDLP
jgi:hypothetical protein